jgi:exodeoxyribonuclease-3
MRTCDPMAPMAVCGDFNVAPEDRDVWDPSRFEGATHVSAPERTALAQLEEWGLVDAFRQRYDEPGLFSWWDYRAGDFHQHRGMRIDLILVTRPLAGRVGFALIDRFARKGKLPSDHAPVLVDFDLEGAALTP